MDITDQPFVLTVTGPKRAGKTHFLRALLKQQLIERFRYIVVLCPSLHLSGDYKFLKEQPYAQYILKHNPDEFSETCTKLFNKIESMKLEGKSLQTLLLMDDCATRSILNNNSVVDKYIIMHRHSNLSMIIVGHSLRGVTGLPKGIRLTIDYNVIFKPASMLELETILKESLFSEDVKAAKLATRRVFNDKYNYIVHIPAATYNNTLLVNFKIPLLDLAKNQDDEKRGRSVALKKVDVMPVIDEDDIGEEFK